MGKIVFLVERLGLLILAGADVALLHYFGGLGVSASALLGVSFTSIEIWLYALKEIAAFKPYGLVIDVNYETLWADLKLTPTDEEPKFKSVTFSAISAAIFARSDERAYSVKLDLFFEIPCGARAWSGFGRPTFFLRPAHEGYQFGVIVDDEWWKLQIPRLPHAYAASLWHMTASSSSDSCHMATSINTSDDGMKSSLSGIGLIGSNANGVSDCNKRAGH